ncbi:MAG: flagellar motor switch protein FliG [Candidatus Midichloriaceae bacterium]|jgi:flagellar motor switch protein FliG
MDKRDYEYGDLEKAAILLLSLNEDNAAKLLKQLSEHDVQKISNKVANLKEVDSEAIMDILGYFMDKLQNTGIIGGNLPKLKRFLKRVFDDEKVDAIIRDTGESLDDTWTSISNIDDKILAEYLKNEYPQTIAFILSKLSSKKASDIISHFSNNFAFEIIKRMLSIDSVNYDIVSGVEHVLKKDLIKKEVSEVTDNNQLVAEIFNGFSKKMEGNFFSMLEDYDLSKASLVRRHMIIFEDIKRVDSKGMQLLIRYSDKSALPKALKIADDSLKEHFLNNMSVRAAKILNEEIDTIKKIKQEEAEESQKKIIYTLRELISNKEIYLDE